MSDVADWLSYTDALARMLERCGRLGVRRIPLDDSLGFALAEQLESRVDHPPWDNSAMDGFAVRADDLGALPTGGPVRLPISEEIPAGEFPGGPLRPGTAVKVMTGAPVPAGATGVVRVEHTDGGVDGTVEIREASDANRNIRRRGEDVRVGTPVASEGAEVTPAVIGILALAGHPSVAVGRRPRIAVLATGDELVDLDDVDEAVAGRKLMNSNSHALAALLRTAGAEPVLLGIARDERSDTIAKLEHGLDCDGIVTTAGVSVGEHDQVKQVLAEMGLERVFWRAKIRPGSPIAFGLLSGKPFWALPGNPVSAMVTFEAFVRPAIRKLAGHTRLHVRASARVRELVVSNAGLTHFFRVRLEHSTGGLSDAYLTGPQGSGVLSSMTAADARLIVPEGVESLEPGTVAETSPLGPPPNPTPDVSSHGEAGVGRERRGP
ncbi:MAG: molybdopterin molybdotransferase MoeA [Gemmatimonadales bacterium]